MGLNSCSSFTRCLIFSTDTPIFSARSFCAPASCGRNSCSGGSRKRIVAGKPFSALKMPAKSSLLIRQQLRERLLAVVDVVGEDHLAHGVDTVPSKNMCSVRHRPMPSAPNAMAFAVCSGLSALVRTCRRRHLRGTSPSACLNILIRLAFLRHRAISRPAPERFPMRRS